MALRAFVAIPLPRGEAIDALVAGLAATGADLAGQDPATLHVTLSFLGDVADDMPPRLATLLDDALVAAPPFTLPLHGVGAFPHARAPRVVWLGARECPELDTLAQRVRQALPPSDPKPFRAHATLARVREGGRLGALPAWLAANRDAALPPARVDAVRIYRSTLAPGGARHELLHETRLEA